MTDLFFIAVATRGTKGGELIKATEETRTVSASSLKIFESKS
jgi:hypothetical protein